MGGFQKLAFLPLEFRQVKKKFRSVKLVYREPDTCVEESLLSQKLQDKSKMAVERILLEIARGIKKEKMVPLLSE